MLSGISIACRKSLRGAVMAVCLIAALAGSHAMVGQMNSARASGDSSGTPVEELRHEILAARRESKVLVQVTPPLPSYELPRVAGRRETTLALHGTFSRGSLSGGQHALRNGLGAPLLA